MQFGSAAGTLDGVRVVEWSNFITAPFCGKVLGELGADVIKIESPVYGDESRRHGPFPEQIPDKERSGLFLFANLNKRGVTLDPSSPSGRELLESLLETADIFLENQPLDLTESLGLDYGTLKSSFPGLIVTSITPYGRTGSYRDYNGCDLTSNAIGGMSFGTGYPDREPLTTPLNQASYLAGVGAAFASVAALLGRDITRKGQLVDVAEAQVVAVLLSGYHLPAYIYRGVAGWRSGNRMRLGLFPNCVLPCKDGYVCIDAPQLEQYQRFLALMGDQDWVNEPRYRDRRAMTEEYPEEAESLITPWFMEHTKEEILAICLENRIPCAPVRTFYEVLDDSHLGGREFFQGVMHPEAGTLKYPGHPYHFSDAPCRYIMPAPLLGQHNLDIFCGELGRRDCRIWPRPV